MSHLIAARLVIGLCLASALAGCGTTADKVTTAKTTETTVEHGCGADYADPQKQFCVTLPAGYTADPNIETDELYSELIHFSGPSNGDRIDISVGFSNSNFTTFDQQVKYNDDLLKTLSGVTVQSTGATKGDKGKWWTYTQDGDIRAITADAPAPNGKTIECKPGSTDPTPAALDACKSVRPPA